MKKRISGLSMCARLAVACSIFLMPSSGVAQITEVIDSSGDGLGNLLAGPFWVVIGGSGEVYLTGDLSNNVFKITDPGLPAQAIVEVIDETGDGIGNTLIRPRGLALDESGNLYVAGGPSDNVFKVTDPGLPTQTVMEIIDGTGDGMGNPLNNPQHLVANSICVYVSGEEPKHNVFKIADPGLPTQTITEIIDESGDRMGNSLNRPRGLALDGSGNLYVAGGGSDNAFKITDPGLPTQTIIEIIDETGDSMGNPLDFTNIIAVGGSGDVFVTAALSDNAFKITDPGLPNQTIVEIIDETGDGTGNQFDLANGIAVGVSGKVYVAGGNTNNVFQITPVGVITELMDETGGGVNVLDGPVGVTADNIGNIYVAGFNSDNAFKIVVPRDIVEIPTLLPMGLILLTSLLCLSGLLILKRQQAGGASDVAP